MREKLLMWLTARLPAKSIDLNGRYYIERYHVLTVGRLTILLHRYFGADGDRQQHDHPHRLSLGIPLIGGYTDERLLALSPKSGAITKRVNIRPWRWNLMHWGRFHRIAAVKPGTWTLFITWHRCKFWGEIVPLCGGDILYRPVPGVKESPNDWYRSAKNGRELRAIRGTDSDLPF